MASVWGELKRRNVAKVAVAYAIVGWLLIEVASTVFPIVQLPDWTVTFLTMLILFGFPIALILSWAYEITPEGMKRERDVVAGESITHVTGRKLDFAIIGALVLALGFVGFDNYVLDEEGAGILPNSVAVLPFENMSADPDDAYFAAGIHDEILNQLAKLKDLNVIARTSVMQYAGAARPITEIARELNVGTIMEGSVSYADGRVAVRAQLIDAETGVHLWSDSYNREFSDVFGIQADIAMNVANALEAAFSVEEQDRIENIPTDSLTAYAFYLRTLLPGADWRSLLDQAIALDPDFALAHALKAYWSSWELIGIPFSTVTREQALDVEQTIQNSANQALALDPNLGLAHAALGFAHMANWRGAEAEEALQRAYRLSPEARVAEMYGRFKRYHGENDEAIRLGERSVQLDPNSFSPHNQLGIANSRARDYDAAARSLQTAREFVQANPGNLMQLAFTEIARGNHDEALEILEIVERMPPVGFRLSQVVHAYGQMGRREDALRMFSVFEESATQNAVGDAVWARSYIGIGDYEQALQRLESAVNNRVLTDFAVLTAFASNPWNDPVLNEPEFRELLDNLWGDG